MTKPTKFFIGLYLLSAVSVGTLFSQNTGSSTRLALELASTKNELASTKSSLETEQATFNNKISAARANAEFLSLALCPNLETSKDALCVKNSTEWFSQTIQTGTTLTDANTKTKIEALLVSLGSKKRPTAKEFYELLKPIELSSLKSLAENLK